MINYILRKDNQTFTFPSLEAVAQFKQANPEWENVEAVSYEEVPESPSPVVPEQVTLWQLRGVLSVMGLEDTVTAVINGMPDGNEKKIALRAWEYANNIRRQSPTVETIKAILNLTDEQTDQIFIQAEQIDA